MAQPASPEPRPEAAASAEERSVRARRRFLTGVAQVGLAGGAAATPAGVAITCENTPPLPGTVFGQALNISKCKGCRDCMTACPTGARVFGIGLVAHAGQLRDGLVVTGMSDQVSWGFDIANFAFLVGIAAGAMLLVLNGYLALNLALPFQVHDQHWQGKEPNLRADFPLVVVAMFWAVSIHTVTAFLFSANAGRPFWHTSAAGAALHRIGLRLGAGADHRGAAVHPPHTPGAADAEYRLRAGLGRHLDREGHGPGGAGLHPHPAGRGVRVQRPRRMNWRSRWASGPLARWCSRCWPGPASPSRPVAYAGSRRLPATPRSGRLQHPADPPPRCRVAQIACWGGDDGGGGRREGWKNWHGVPL
jgi:ferredoxin